MISLTGLQKKLREAKNKNIIVSVRTKPNISSFECENVDGTYECELLEQQFTKDGKPVKASKAGKATKHKKPRKKKGKVSPTPQELREQAETRADIIQGRNQQIALGTALQRSQERFSLLRDNFGEDIPPNLLKQEQEQDEQEQQRLMERAEKETERQRSIQTQTQQRPRVLSYKRGHNELDAPRDNLNTAPIQGREFDLTADDITMEGAITPSVSDRIAQIEGKIHPNDDKFRNIKHKDFKPEPLSQPKEYDLGLEDVIQQPKPPTLNERMLEPIITEETIPQPAEELQEDDPPSEEEEEQTDELEGSVEQLKPKVKTPNNFLPELPPKNGRFYTIAEIRSQPTKIRNKIFTAVGIKAKQTITEKERQYKDKFIY